MNHTHRIYLLDLPCFPKGVLSLSFPAIAACIPTTYKIHFLDLNLHQLSQHDFQLFKNKQVLFAGLKVSSQNYPQAIQLTQQLKRYHSGLIVMWGGEFPSLQPQKALQHADVAIVGAFEPVAYNFFSDLEQGTLKTIYDSRKNYSCALLRQPRFNIISQPQQYYSAFGFPMESSRGCDKKCTFCMVHHMQPVNNFKTPHQLEKELHALEGQFVNVVDYNIGSNAWHLHNLIAAFTKSKVLGWSAELCLETLDNEDLLKKLAQSRCRMVYCGLESIDDEALKSINKARTNHVNNYARIIKRAQAHGLHIAAGIIIGLEGATAQSINRTFEFYQSIGVIYAKITFLTYNPGTKVFESMKRVGQYITEEEKFFDGNHLTFLPEGVKSKEIIPALIKNIQWFYKLSTIKKRAKAAGSKGDAFAEFVGFNQIYRQPYLQWLKYKVFENEAGFEKLLNRRFKKSKTILLAEQAILKARKNQLKTTWVKK